MPTNENTERVRALLQSGEQVTHYLLFNVWSPMPKDVTNRLWAEGNAHGFRFTSGEEVVFKGKGFA